MSQRIHLAAIVASQGRLLLVRSAPDAPWELPGGPLLAEHEDVDAAMDAHLERFGISAPAIEGDFVETIHLPRDEGHTVFNLYAASEWRGEPTVPPGMTMDWFGLYDLDAIPMDDRVRDAVLMAFGLKEHLDPTDRILAELKTSVFGPERFPGITSQFPAAVTAFQRGEPPAGTALDVSVLTLQAVAVLAALGRREALATHIEFALGVGVGAAELAETLHVVATCAGMPAAAEAWEVLERVLATRGKPRPETAL